MAQTPDYPPATGWAVTGQQETTEFGPNNTPVSGWRVAFTTKEGVAGSVFIPRAQYRPDNVANAIAAEAAVIDAVHQLRG